MSAGTVTGRAEIGSKRHERKVVGTRRVKPAAHFPHTAGLLARLAYERAKAAGVALPPLLKRARLTRRQIEDRLRLEVHSQISFVNLVADELADDLLGFHLAELVELGEVGLFYYVLASSETLIDVFRRGARYSSIVNEGIAQECVDGRSTGIALRFVDVSRHRDRHQIEFWTTAFVRACRQLTGVRLIPHRMRLVHHREHGRAELAKFFRCEIEFGAAVDEVNFVRRTRNLPVLNADPYLNRLLITFCEEALTRQSRTRGSFRTRVENAIVPLLPHGNAQVEVLARQLGVSERTFARRLKSEGLTFSDLLVNLRLDLANRYLIEDLSISEVAWLLGYQEVSAFSRAFKRWTGKAPSQAASRVLKP